MVEADPPARPARKEDRGAVLVDDGVVGCWHCCVRVDDDDDDDHDDGNSGGDGEGEGNGDGNYNRQQSTM